VRVGLPRLERLPGQKAFRIEVIHPGESTWAPLQAKDEDGAVTLDVPLKRGCAIVKLSTSWIAPAATYFTTSTRLNWRLSLTARSFTTRSKEAHRHSIRLVTRPR